MDAEAPLLLPPKRFAVARSPYGAPPRCVGLCCHLGCAPPTPPTPPTPPGLPTPPILWKLFSGLTRMKAAPPQPQPQPQPPSHAAPKKIPTPNPSHAPP